MDTTFNLSATFGPATFAGKKFAEFYGDFEAAITCSLGGETITTKDYEAKRDDRGNFEIFSPDEQLIDAIDGSNPDFSELDAFEKESYVINTLLDGAVRHKMLNSTEGRNAIAQDLQKGISEGLTARIPSR